jgi:hypothetical protein
MRVLLAFALLGAAAASLRGGAPLDPAVSDVEDQLASVVSDITAQAYKFDCATAGAKVTDTMKQIQDRIAQRRDGLAAKCEGRKASVDSALEDEKAKHAATMVGEVKNLTAIMKKTMAPLEKVLAETRGEHQAKVDRATNENVTAWAALKKDRKTFANLTGKLAAANAAYVKTKNASKAVMEAEKAEAAEARDATNKEAQDAFDLKQKNIAKAKKRGQSRCFNETNQERELNKQHKDLIDKVLPLVQALKDCKAGKNGAKPVAGAAGAAATTAFLERGDDCNELSSELSGHFTGATMFLELVQQNDPVTAIVSRVNANITATADKHKACLDEHGKVVDAMLSKAQAALDGAKGNATAIEARRNEAADAAKQAVDDKALAKVDAVQAAINAALQRLGSVGADAGDEEDGSISLARRKRRHLKVALEAQFAAVSKALNMVKEEQDRQDAALDKEKARLDQERLDADKTSLAMAVAAKAGIKANCDKEAEVLADEAKMADESEMKLFSIVAKIDPNADKATTTTPKPIILPVPLSKSDGTSVTTYQLVAATSITGTCQAAGMAAVPAAELDASEAVCNMVKDKFAQGAIMVSVTAPKFNALSGATIVAFNPSTCKSNAPAVMSFTYKEFSAKVEANVGKKLQVICKSVAQAVSPTTSL